MSLTTEEARKLVDLRQQVLKNIQSGLPPHTGLDKDFVKECVAISRKEYTANQSKSKASGVSSPSAAAPMDLTSLFTTKKSG